MFSRTVRSLVSFTAAGALGLGVAACGDDSADAGGPGSGRADDETQLAFARCMRDRGIDIPDPGTGPQRIRIPANVSRTKLQESMEACREETGGGPPELSDEQRTEFRDAALRFARCMRANGVDVPDPTGDGPGGGLLRMARGVDLDSPAARRAMEACEDELPVRPGGPGPAPGAAAGDGE